MIRKIELIRCRLFPLLFKSYQKRISFSHPSFVFIFLFVFVFYFCRSVHGFGYFWAQPRKKMKSKDEQSCGLEFLKFKNLEN